MFENSTQKNPDDIVVTLALRTPLAKARKGGFKDSGLDYIVYALLKETLAKSNLDPALIEDVCLGNVSIHASVLPSALVDGVSYHRSTTAKPLTFSAPLL